VPESASPLRAADDGPEPDRADVALQLGLSDRTDRDEGKVLAPDRAARRDRGLGQGGDRGFAARLRTGAVRFAGTALLQVAPVALLRWLTGTRWMPVDGGEQSRRVA
jgi:hypothetical protein